jgi:membrane protein YqaA with SNARE-associated domain
LEEYQYSRIYLLPTMGPTVGSEGPANLSKRKWLKDRIVPLLTLTLVIGIIVSVFYFYKEYPEKIDALQDYGYLGAFVISIILNATVVLPVGNFAFIITLGAILPIFPLVGIAGGLGAAIGEMTGYMAGYSGRGIIQKQNLYKRLEEWVAKWGALAIFVLSAVPLFFDVAGLAAGAMRFPVWKFFVACWLGRTLLYIVFAWIGAMGWELFSGGL